MEGINWTQWASKDASVEDVAKEVYDIFPSLSSFV